MKICSLLMMCLAKSQFLNLLSTTHPVIEVCFETHSGFIVSKTITRCLGGKEGRFDKKIMSCFLCGLQMLISLQIFPCLFSYHGHRCEGKKVVYLLSDTMLISCSGAIPHIALPTLLIPRCG